MVMSQEVLIFHPAEWFYFPLPSASNSGSRIPYNMEQEKTNKKNADLGKDNTTQPRELHLSRNSKLLKILIL